MISRPRIMLYSHDTYGLGHLRRSLAIAQQIAQDIPGSHQLLLTGSMVAGAFGLPPRLDMVKLPALSKRSSGQYKSRTLPLTLKQTLTWREQMILQATINFRPDLVLVDKVAAGVHGELLPALRHLKTWSPATRLVLGMRDIEDSPPITKREWAERGTRALLDDVYDHILYYGQRDLFDPVRAYGMSAAAAGKLIECGYLRREETTRRPSAVRRELGIGDKPLVVVTVGGGGDGYDIIKTYLAMVAAHGEEAPFHSLVVAGPLMPRAKRKAFLSEAKHKAVTPVTFTPDLASYLKAADLIVSMAGYNSVCEILSLQKRAVLIPRARVRVEQRIRAAQMAERGLVRLLLPEELTAERLGAQVEAALNDPLPVTGINLDGLPRVSAAVTAMLGGEPPLSANGHQELVRDVLVKETQL